MGTKIHCKSYLPAHYSMRDLNEDSSIGSWPLFCEDKAVTNGQYYNGFMPRTTIDCHPGYNKDALKQKMLEHEAVFKDQVCELHRLYRIQRDMMEEVRRQELIRFRESMEQSSSSSLRGSQVPPEDARKWHMLGFPLLNSGHGGTSISGIETVNSPMSCTKGSSRQPYQFSFQNGSISKDSEALDSRTLKVRKKLFDLELPADECIDIDEGEKLREIKVPDMSSNASNEDVKIGLESSSKLSPGVHTGSKTDCRIVALSSASCLRNSAGLADLNEPIKVEESIAPSPIGFLGHSSINGETKGANLPAKLNPGYLGVNGETVHVQNEFFINSVESKVYERGHQSEVYETGSSKRTHGLWQDKSFVPFHPAQSMLNPTNHPPGNYPTGYGRDDQWRERNCHGLESLDSSHDCSKNGHLKPLVASEAHTVFPFHVSSGLANSRAESVSSWTKPKDSFTQNSGAAMDRSMQTSASSLVSFGGNWQVDASTSLNPGLETTANGFYPGSASGSKDLKVHLSSNGSDYRNCSRGGNMTPEHPINGVFDNFPKGCGHVDSKPVLDINLNEVVSKGSENEAVVLEDLSNRNGKGKPEDHLSALPWLKHKPAHADKAATTRRSEAIGGLSNHHASSDQLCCSTGTVRDLNEPFTPLASGGREIVRKKEIVESQSVHKILGFPIVETGALEMEPPSHVSAVASVDCPPEENSASEERKNKVIDINLECEPDEQITIEELSVERGTQTKLASTREVIDLNSCAGECEDPSAPSYQSKTSIVKVTLEIDLEAPVLQVEGDNATFEQNPTGEMSSQQLENKNEALHDEVLRNAAEAIVAISSFCPEENVSHQLEASLAESLLWFVDALPLRASELESTLDNELTVTDGLPNDFSEEIDEFEGMTLQLPETKEEDYVPKPFVPEVQAVEETGANTLLTRSRRGQSRRGRQRRDFQRDILPGLASLSRHEVTEDLQIFGGLMRATGHHWISGLTRRNGTRNRGGRGRRRAVVEPVSTATPSSACTPLVQQLSNIESGLEDRSLTGWGKTTRRPRRQRCPAGNTPTVVLTQ